MQKLQGIAVSPGVAIGEALVMDNEGFRIPRRFVARDAVVDEIERLDKAIAAAASKKREGVRSTYAFLMPEIRARRERGETMPEIMDWLNQQGYTTTAGKPFTQTAVWRLIDRYLGKDYLGNSKKGTQGSKVARRCAS